MRILMRNTVFKTAVLTGLFSCLLAFVGAFPGITASVHAMHADDAIHANEVGTDEEKLQEFVEAAVDEYYIEFLIKGHCDFGDLLPPPEELPVSLETALSFLVPDIAITDLSPSSIQLLLTDEVKQLIAALNNIDKGPFAQIVQGFFPDGVNIWEACPNLPQPPATSSTLHEVFRGPGEENWKSDPIYLFVMDDQKEVLFHGADENFEGQTLVAEDRGGRDVAQLIIDEVRDTESDGDGLFDYCWDDPTIEEDNEDNPDFTAPGFSWKTSYVVDPFDYLELDPPSGSTGVIFGSGIYPKDGTPPLECKIFADTDDTG